MYLLKVKNKGLIVNKIKEYKTEWNTIICKAFYFFLAIGTLTKCIFGDDKFAELLILLSECI